MLERKTQSSYFMKEKLDEENIYNDPFAESKKLPPNVRKFYEDAILDIASNQLSFIQNCESPIEQLMGLALKAIENDFSWMADNGCYSLDPQYEATCNDNTYRIDFCLHAIFKGRSFKVAIECDGHEFHEKTKEQVEKDNIRSRNLTMAGYLLARFSGKEIVRSPYSCARAANHIVFRNEG